MLETVNATIDPSGKVSLLERVKLGRKHKALVTILDDEPDRESEWSLAGSATLIDDDLEDASRKFAAEFSNAIRTSGEEFDGEDR
jgi:hypothetical protein